MSVTESPLPFDVKVSDESGEWVDGILRVLSGGVSVDRAEERDYMHISGDSEPDLFRWRREESSPRTPPGVLMELTGGRGVVRSTRLVVPADEYETVVGALAGAKARWLEEAEERARRQDEAAHELTSNPAYQRLAIRLERVESTLQQYAKWRGDDESEMVRLRQLIERLEAEVRNQHPRKRRFLPD